MRDYHGLASRQTRSLSIEERSQVGAARRASRDLAKQLGLAEETVDRLVLVVSEAATNLLKHAQRGEILLRGLIADDHRGLEMLAVDQGPGMRDVRLCLQDGYSTTGSAGTGLGAVKRLSDVFDIYSRAGQGTALLAQIWADRKPFSGGCLQFGAVSVPAAGQQLCGDGWYLRRERSRALLVVVDGLGHGPLAHSATEQALTVVAAWHGDDLVQLIAEVDKALGGTRGAVMGVAALDLVEHRLHFCGVGNVAAVSFVGRRRHGLVSHSGILGHRLRTCQLFSDDWPEGEDALLVMHSDGLSARWSLESYPGLTRSHPSLIAGLLYRDGRRARDDATVAVIRRKSVG